MCTWTQFGSINWTGQPRGLTRGAPAWLTKKGKRSHLHDLTTSSSEACAQQVGPDLQSCIIGGVAVVQAIMSALRSTACRHCKVALSNENSITVMQIVNVRVTNKLGMKWKVAI